MLGFPKDQGCLRDDDTVTISIGGECKLLIFQVLTVDSDKLKLVKTFRGFRRRAFHFGLQMFEAWGSYAEGADHLTVFAVGDTVRVDARRLSKWQSLRHGLRRWDTSASDVAGCVTLVNPRHVQPETPRSSPSCPTLLILEDLTRQGWKPIHQVCMHTPENMLQRQLSTIDGASKKFYYQCLLRLGDLFKTGVTCLPSNEPQSFYKVLLSGRCVEPGKGHKYYDNILRNAQEAPEPPLAIADAEEEVKMLEDFVQEPTEPLAIEDFFEPVRQPRKRTRTPAVPVEDLLPPPPSPPALVGDLVEDVGEGDGADAATAEEEWQWPRVVDGARVRREHWNEPGKAYVRYGIVCTHHARCLKFRNAGPAQIARHGRIEPFAYLAAWHMRGPEAQSASEHNALRPTLAQQDAWLRAEGQGVPR